MQFSTVFLSALALTPAEHPEQHIFALYKHKGLACARKRKRISARPRTLPRRLRLHLTAATQGRRWNQQARVGPKTGPRQVGAPWEHLVIASLPDQTGSRHIYIYIYIHVLVYTYRHTAKQNLFCLSLHKAALVILQTRLRHQTKTNIAPKTHMHEHTHTHTCHRTATECAFAAGSKATATHPTRHNNFHCCPVPPPLATY